MMVAAKTIALSAADILRNPEILKPASAELKQARGGENFQYRSLAGDRKAPLDYRKQ
jgi:aminobenzoyl-glutamate utilization protein B